MTFEQDLAMLAPSVETHWRDDFILELRLRGVRGAVITDALAEVETHCHESGQSAAQAFGPAKDYARALELPDESGWTPAQLVRTWSAMLLLLAGVGLSILGGVDLLRGERAEVSAGLLVSYGAIVVVMVVVFVMGRHVMRVFMDHPVWSTVGFSLAMAGVFLVALPLDDLVLGSLPAGPTLVAGLVALAAAATIHVVARRTGRSLDDPLIPPVPREHRRVSRR